jgi:hypothetical protein
MREHQEWVSMTIFGSAWPEYQNGAETRCSRKLMGLVPQCGDQIGIAQLYPHQANCI